MNEIDICRLALFSVGAAPISGFDDGTVEAEVCAAWYPTTRDTLLSSFPWTFAVEQVELEPSTSSPLAEWMTAYLLPANTLRLRCVSARSRRLTYAVKGRYVFADELDAIVVEIIGRPAAADFPAYFVQALACSLAANLCLPLSGASDRWQALGAIAEREVRRARLTDSQQDTPEAMDSSTLIAVR